MRKTTEKEKQRLLPFHTILDATSGSPLALEKVLKHFEGYMITLSTRKLTVFIVDLKLN